MPITRTPLVGFPWDDGIPFTHITPFTHRDGLTYLRKLEQLQAWMYEKLVPWINEALDQYDLAFNEQIAALVADVNANLAETIANVNEGLTEQTADNAAKNAALLASVTALTTELTTLVQNTDTALRADMAAAVNAVINATITVTDPIIVGVVGNKDSASRALLDSRYKPSIYLEDYLLPADNGDYSLALQRACVVASATGAPIQLRAMYALKSNIANLSQGVSLIGQGRDTGFYGPTNAPVLALNWTNATNVELRNFSYDGGVTSAMTGKNYTRGIRFRDSSGIKLRDMFVRNVADWGTSFERCNGVNVRDHTHEFGGLGTPGGRDGIHVLDCSNVFINEADIWSGDDCIGMTSETVGLKNITVKNIRGRSDIASVVIANEEGATTFPIENITIDGVRTIQPVRNVVRVQGINSATVVQHITVSNVIGETRVSHGLWFGRVKDLSVDKCSVATLVGNAHGVFVASCERFGLTNVEGTTATANYDGIHVVNSSYGALTACRSSNAALWGFQLNGAIMVTVTDCIAINGGTVAFDGNSGGGIRVVNGADVTVDGGYFGGERTYTGLSFSGSSRFRCTDRTRLGGANLRSSEGTGINAMQAPKASIHFKASALNITVQSAYRAQIDEPTLAGEFVFRPLKADGTVDAFRAAFPHFQITVGHPSAAGTTARRLIAVVTAVFASSIRFQIIDVSTNTLASADYISVTVWDQP